MEERKKEREPQFELLRIISMLLIVLLHFLSHGGVNDQLVQGSASYFIFSILRSFAYLGVNCFILISGYFLCDKEFKFSRIVKIAMQTLFYSIMGSAIAILLLHKPLSAKEFLFTIFPISGGKYWFASVYVLMLIISPIINFALKTMTKKQHLVLIIILFLFFSLFSTILLWSKSVFSDGKDIAWFLTLYVIAAYLKRYPIHIKRSWLCGLFLCMVLSTVFIEFGIKMIASRIGLGSPEKVMFYNNQPLILGGSILLFALISGLKIEHFSNVICKVGNLTFGIYLLHDNDLLRNYLWEKINAPRYLQNVPAELGYMCTVVLLIF